MSSDTRASAPLRSSGWVGGAMAPQRRRASYDAIGSVIGDFGCAFAILFVFSFLNSFLNRNGLFSEKSSTTYPLVYGAAAMALLASAQARDAIRRHFVFMGVVAAHLALMGALVISKPLHSLQTEIFHDRIQSAAITISCLILAMSQRRFQRSLDLLAIVVMGACALNLLEFFHLLPSQWQFTYVRGRSAGLYANPNTSAFFIATALPLITATRSSAVKLLMLAAAFVGIFFTFSRGGLITWMCAAAAVYLFGERQRRVQIMPILLIGAGVFLAYISLNQIFQALDPHLSAGTGSRLQLAVDQNIRDRIGLAGAGWRAFTENPLTGLGVGYTYQWEVGNDVHNLILMIAAEYGVIGLLWFAAYAWSIRRYSAPPAYWFLIVLLVSSMFTHNHLDHTAFGVLTALYIVTAARMREASDDAAIASRP